MSAALACKTAVVIGAGLGGLATAIALHQQGIAVQVYERAQALKPVGAGITLFPNGLKTLQALNREIVERLNQLGSPTKQVNLKKSNGEIIFQNPITLGQRYGQSMLNIRWSSLQETLLKALPPDCLHLDHAFVGFESQSDQVIAKFANGTAIATDLLIGADGIHSLIRQILTQEGAPRYAGRMSWRAVVPFSHPELRPQEVTLMTLPTGKNFMMADVGQGEWFWSAGSLSEIPLPSYRDPQAIKATVLEEFADWADPVAEILAATPAETIVERPICDRPPLTSWSQGRVTLLGDAAHPMVPSLGQGANSAFEDAYVLAQCLAHAETVENAIAQYEQQRIYRTQLIQARSALQGSRSYQQDSEVYLKGIAQQIQANQPEFEDWLYRFP